MDRFDKWYRVDKATGCWNWIGADNWPGRPRFMLNGRSMIAARYSWERTNGEIPEGKYICHTCDNRLCVNPEHLFAATQKENIRDASRKGRMKGRPKLTLEQVTEIRRLYSTGRSQSSLAREFGVYQSNVWYIVTNNSWRSVT